MYRRLLSFAGDAELGRASYDFEGFACLSLVKSILVSHSPELSVDHDGEGSEGKKEGKIEEKHGGRCVDIGMCVR